MATKDLSITAGFLYRASAITVHKGEDVLSLLNEAPFQRGWDELYEACPWATVFQSRAFVATWYQVYQRKYLPILVKSVEGTKLTGLLTMALLRKDSGSAETIPQKGRIIGAGRFEAEYQTWLALPSNGGDFITNALSLLEKQFPLCDIQFRYVPAGTPLNWIEKEKKWTARCVLQSFSRPLMDMRDPDLPKLFRKTEFRNKFNRLKRLGVLQFDRITDFGQFAAGLNELITLYDFRQGAMFNKNQFRNEPLKTELLLALFKQHLLHVTFLKVNGTIWAAIIAVIGKDWVHLGGINIHTPFHAKFYSPGFVHFILLGQKLAQEGTAVFDLTPGGDFYKERMATRHDQVYELTISSRFAFRMKRRLRKLMHHWLLKAGQWPMGTELRLRKKLYVLRARMRMVKQQGAKALVVNTLKTLAAARKKEVVYALGKLAAATTDVRIAKNSLSDLLSFEAKGTWMTRWEFLQDAMHRFEVGQQCLSWSEGKRLQGCVWTGKGVHTAQGSTGNVAEEGAIALQEFYCHPAGQARLKDFLIAAAAAAAKETASEGRVFAITTANEKMLGQSLEEIGFTPQ